MGILAGVYIAFGSCLTLAVGGACAGLAANNMLGAQNIIKGAFGLPFGELCWMICHGVHLASLRGVMWC